MARRVSTVQIRACCLFPPAQSSSVLLPLPRLRIIEDLLDRDEASEEDLVLAREGHVSAPAEAAGRGVLVRCVFKEPPSPDR